jgi:tetratricopeptide (TPR) repeat protein
VEIARKLQDDYLIQNFLCDYGWTLGAQDKFVQAIQSFEESLTILDGLKDIQKIERASKISFFGAVLLRKGEFQKGKELLIEGLKIKETLQDVPGIQEPLLWLAFATESFGELDEANNYYNQCLEWKWYGRYYFDCAAITGLIRVKHAQGDHAAIPPLLAEAEQLAQQYEYNDHLASLRLSQGHLAWENDNPAETLAFYQKAMTYALRYNRFLLDELVSGRPQGTPLRPIIPSLREHGESGRKTLMALHDWWQTGTNDIGTPRPDTISSIPEGIALLEAEKLAREREPGDGSIQKSVVEQFEAVL